MATKSETEAQAKKAEQMKLLQSAISEIEKTHGKGTIIDMGDTNHIEAIPVIPTSSLSLDIALGVGGIPRGRIVEIYGPESSGKTTLSLAIIAQAQKHGGVAAFIDAENAFDVAYSKNCGVKVDELLVSQPESGETALQIVDTLASSGAVSIIVVDSVSALVPQSEIDGVIGDQFMGLQARLMSQALRKLSGVAARSGTAIVFINQIREKMNVKFGSPETTSGGRALKFYSSIRLDIRRIETLKNGIESYGNKVKVKAVKNKCAPPGREAIFDIIFGSGVDSLGDIVNLAVKSGIIEKSGSWFSYNGNRIGQGDTLVKKWLREDTAAYDQIEAKVRSNPTKALEVDAKPVVIDEVAPAAAE